MIRTLAAKLIPVAEQARKRFITFHTRPMDEYPSRYRNSNNAYDAACAIVVQGPIRHQDNFTFESINLYRKHYPAATIILSTWDTEDTRIFEPFLGNNFIMVKSIRPLIPGHHNINMQLVSTKNGVEMALKLGLKYTLKTRTDQRMYGINIPTFMQNLLNYFPVHGETTQKQRIISTASGTSKSWPYHFSDLFMFGTTHDIYEYWDVELRPEAKYEQKGFVPEQFLLTAYLKKTGWDVTGTMEDFMRALGERCVVIDNESIDIYWPKYAAIWREYRLRNYWKPTIEISFKTWLNEGYLPYTMQTPKQ